MLLVSSFLAKILLKLRIWQILQKKPYSESWGDQSRAGQVSALAHMILGHDYLLFDAEVAHKQMVDACLLILYAPNFRI